VNATAPYTLGDLLALQDFGLELQTGGPGAFNQTVAGAHAIEIASPSQWLERDWVMLTNGVRLKGDRRAQRDLIEELHEAEIGALGFSVGTVFDEIPAGLLDAGRACDFPVFRVPLSTPHREIVTAVTGAHLSDELRIAQRVGAIGQFLMLALDDPEPRRTVVERLARVLDARIVVLGDPRTESAASHLGPDLDELRAALAERPVTPQELVLSRGWHAVAVPTPQQRCPGGAWLVAATRGAFQPELVRSVLRTAAPLLAATDRLARAHSRQELALRAAALEELLQRGSSKPTPVPARAEALGVGFAEPGQVAIVGFASPAQGERVVQALDLWAAQGGHAYLAAPCAEEIVVFAEAARPALITFLTDLVAAEAHIVVGVGRPHDRADDVAQSYRDARLALEEVEPDAPAELRVRDFASFDLTTCLISEVAPERVRPKVDAIVAVLHANEPLHETLVAFFDNQMDVAKTARQLFLHANSLRYRLNRIEQLLGCSLKDPAAIANLYLALAMNRCGATDDA
jgi:DNA-binding PucR family transcriptional regulator